MPVIDVSHLPEGTRKKKLVKLRREIVAAVAKELPTVEADARSWVIVNFHQDRLDDSPPKSIEDGGSTVIVEFKTAFFAPQEGDSDEVIENRRATALGLLVTICNLIGKALKSKFEVEGFVVELDPEMKYIFEPGQTTDAD